MGQTYQTIKKLEVKAICNKIGVEEFSSSESNHSMTYKLKNGQVFVWPAGGNLALLFENVKDYESATEDGHIPLKSTDPVEREEDQAIVLGMPGNAHLVIDQLSAKLGMPLKLEGLDDAYIKAFVDKVAKYGYDKAYSELFLALTIYVGELAVRSKHARWRLVTKYGINPYYDVELYNDKRVIDVFRDVVKFLDGKSKTAGTVMMVIYRN